MILIFSYILHVGLSTLLDKMSTEVKNVLPLWLMILKKNVLCNDMIKSLSLNEHRQLVKIMIFHIINAYKDYNILIYNSIKKKNTSIIRNHITFKVIRECDIIYNEYILILCEKYYCRTYNDLQIYKLYFSAFTKIQEKVKQLHNELKEKMEKEKITNYNVSVYYYNHNIIDKDLTYLRDVFEYEKIELCFNSLTKRYGYNVDEYGKSIPIPLSVIYETFSKYEIETHGCVMPLELIISSYTLPKLPHKNTNYDKKYRIDNGIIYTCKAELEVYINELREKYSNVNDGIITRDDYKSICKHLAKKCMISQDMDLLIKSTNYNIKNVIEYIQQYLMNRTYFAEYNNLDYSFNCWILHTFKI